MRAAVEQWSACACETKTVPPSGAVRASRCRSASGRYRPCGVRVTSMGGYDTRMYADTLLALERLHLLRLLAWGAACVLLGTLLLAALAARRGDAPRGH